VPKARSNRPSNLRPAASAAGALVDLGFIPARAKLIEVAAFLDRVERHGVAGDFRCVALREAAALLVDGKAQRARRMLESLSDPTAIPDEKSTGKAALGAWQPAAAAGVQGKVGVNVPGRASAKPARLPNRD